MSRKMTLLALFSGLFVAAVLVGAYSSIAEDRPPIKTPSPIKPLPPAKPNDPLKPQEPAKPRATAKSAEPSLTLTTGSMPDKATREALAKKVSLDFTDAPLQKIVDSLTEQTKLEIDVATKDSTTGAESDSSEKEKLTIHVSGISASSTLDLVARDLGWNWFADQGAVLITNDDRLPPVPQVYNVRDLVLAHPSGGQDEALDYEYTPLADVITGAIPSPSWTPDAAGLLQDCTPFHGTLTINQDQKVQDHVAGLLAALRKSRDLGTPQQSDAAISAGLSIGNVDETAIDAALAKSVAAEPTAAKLDDLADWIRKTYSIPVHIDAHARSAGLPSTAIADTGGAAPGPAAKPDVIAKTEPVAKAEAAPKADATAKPDSAPKPEIREKADPAKPHVPAAAPISPAAPASVVGLPLKEALDLLFTDSKLGFTVRDEVLLITTNDDEKSLRSVRVYPVGDLIGGEIDKDGVDEEYARLLDVITRSVEPDSWATLDKAKAGTAFITYLPQGRAMVCTQNRAAHEQVAEMLGKVRKAIEEQGPATKASATASPASGKETAHALATKIYKLNPDLPADDFVIVVKDLVEPKTWAGDAYIHGVPGAIIVKQSGPIQKRVEKMLIDLGAIPDPKKISPSGTPTLVGKRKAT